MAEFIDIQGGVPLTGTVRVSGAKNAALPLLIASLLTPEVCEFTNVPNLEDTNLTLRLLEHVGATTSFMAGSSASAGDEQQFGPQTGSRDDDAARFGAARFGGKVVVHTPELVATEASYSLVKALRASFWVLGPLLARGRAARVALPGGDIIGARPVDMHLAALTKMGADIRVKHGVVFATAEKGLRPAEIEFSFPSVGATHQVIMAGALTPGVTVIRGAAREPEIVALANMINEMGGSVVGAGTSSVVIQGVEQLGGARVKLIGDRIEAGTYLLATIATRGVARAVGITPSFFGEFLPVLERLGVGVTLDEDSVTVDARGALKPVRVATGPYPELATDLQAPLMAALATVSGESAIEENVFEGRFGHVAELGRMGATIHVRDRVALIDGGKQLSGAPVEALDIRAGAALVIAALAADGRTQIFEPQHLRRGYDSLQAKLQGLGARVGYRVSDAEDFAFAGC